MCYSSVAERQILVPVSLEIPHTHQLYMSHLVLDSFITSFAYKFVSHAHKREYFIIAKCHVTSSALWYQSGDQPMLIFLHLLLTLFSYFFLPVELSTLLTNLFLHYIWFSSTFILPRCFSKPKLLYHNRHVYIIMCQLYVNQQRLLCTDYIHGDDANVSLTHSPCIHISLITSAPKWQCMYSLYLWYRYWSFCCMVTFDISYLSKLHRNENYNPINSSVYSSTFLPMYS